MIAALLPLLAAWTLGNEIPLGRITATNPPSTRSINSLASNGRDFLALWSDRRNALDPNISQIYPALYMGRIDANGRPLNPTGTKLFESASGCLTWTGSSYLLVYTLPNSHSFARQLDSDANFIGDSSELFTGQANAIVSNGADVLLLHSSVSQIDEISILSADGTVLATKTIAPIDGAPRPFVLPGGDYAFVANRTVCPGNVPCAQRASLVIIQAADGSVSEQPLLDTTYWAQASAAPSADGRILVAVQQDQQGSRTASYEIVDRTGRVIAPMQTLESEVPLSISGVASPSVGWDGGQFLVTVQWPSSDERTDQLQGFRIAPDGTRLDPYPLVLDSMTSGFAEPPLFASSSSVQLMAWQNVAPGATALLARAAASFDNIVFAQSQSITTSAAPQYFPRLASGSPPFAVWIESAGAPLLAGALVGSTDSLSTAATAMWTAPAVARGNSEFLVAWRQMEPFRVFGQRISLGGETIGSPFVIGSEDASPQNSSWPDGNLSIGFDGLNFLAAWLGGDGWVHAARISENGNVLDAAPLVLSDAQTTLGQPVTPRVVATTGGFVVAWLQQQFCGCLISPPPPPISKLYTARVNDSGSVTALGSAWSRTGADSLALTSGGNGNLAAVWREFNYLSAGPICVYRTLFSADGSATSDVAPLRCELWSPGLVPSLNDLDATWDGSALALAWRDDIERVFVQRYDPQTTLPLDAPLQVNPADTQAIAPSIAATPTGLAIAYQRLADVSRVFVRTLDFRPPPPRRRAIGR